MDTGTVARSPSSSGAPEFINKLASELYRGDESGGGGTVVDNLIDFSSLERDQTDETQPSTSTSIKESDRAQGAPDKVQVRLPALESERAAVGDESGSSGEFVSATDIAEVTASTITKNDEARLPADESSKNATVGNDDNEEDDDDVLGVGDEPPEDSNLNNSISTRSVEPGGSSPSRDPSRPRRTPKVSAYNRLVGKRRASVTMVEDPTAQTGMFSWARDKVLGLVAGESPEERKTRLRLNWYRQVLISEVDVVEKARQHFSNHGKDLAIEFEMQELQLQKWGLLNILPAFRMQAWARVSRSALLEDMAIVAERILKQRLARANDVISLYASDSKGNRKHPLDSYNAFCLVPEKVMAKEPALAQLGHRLQRMDKVCNSSLHIFKTMLPELESRTFVQRKHMLADIMARYAQLVAMSEPASLEESLGWPEFCDWYALRHQEMAELEREFGNFVEDEREREGRLFRRWCTLTLMPDEAGGVGEEQVIGTPLLGTLGLAQEPTQQAVKAPKMSARSIVAFIRHFAVNVIASKYTVEQPRHETLVALTESLVYRRINSVVLRYPVVKLQERDAAWRSKCSLCRFINPVTYGVPVEYAFGPDRVLELTAGAASASGGEATSVSSRNLVDDAAAGAGTSSSGGADVLRLDRSSSTSTIDFNLIEQSSSRDYENESIHSRSSGKASALGGRGGGPRVPKQTGKQSALFQEAEILPQRLSLSGRLQSLPDFPPRSFGAPYAHASRILSLLSVSITPREITHNLLLAVKWLLKDAVALSGKRDYLGADLMFPILVLVLINAQIPCMHLVLHFLHKFGEYDVQGEAAYYVTCLEAAVAFVLRIEVPTAVATTSGATDGAAAASAVTFVDFDNEEEDDGQATDDAGPGAVSLEAAEKDSQHAEMDMDKLSEWLRDQQTMEETIEILQNEGWMV